MKMRTRRGIVKDKRGFTGLEAAIVLTAFIVVAAVFSYMVLGAGFFSTEKAKAVIHTGVEKATSSAEVTGDVIGHGWKYEGDPYYYSNHTADTTNLTVVEFQVELTAGQEPLDMNKVVLSYTDEDTYTSEITYRTDAGSGTNRGKFAMPGWNYTLATSEMGKPNMLDPNEKMTIIVALPDYGVTANKQFSIDFKPAKGGSITITKTAPGTIDKTMVLK